MNEERKKQINRWFNIADFALLISKLLKFYLIIVYTDFMDKTPELVFLFMV